MNLLWMNFGYVSIPRMAIRHENERATIYYYYYYSLMLRIISKIRRPPHLSLSYLKNHHFGTGAKKRRSEHLGSSITEVLLTCQIYLSHGVRDRVWQKKIPPSRKKKKRRRIITNEAI